MASVKIILKESKTKKDGTSPLYLQLIHNKKSTEVSLQKSILSKYWNKEKQKIRSSYSNYSPLNIAIHNEKRRYEKIIADKLARMEVFSVNDIVAIGKGKQALNKSKGSFIKYLEDYISLNPENLTFNTLKNYKSTLSRLKVFQPKVTFGDLKKDWLIKLESFFRDSGNSVNTIHCHMKIVKKMTSICRENNKITLNPFSNYKLKSKAGDREYLTKDELNRLRALSNLPTTYELVRDVFLFSCFVGLRFGDIVTLKADDIREEKDNKKNIVRRLSLKMQKTDELLTIKLSKVPLGLIQKHSGKSKNNFLFPVLKLSTNNGEFGQLEKEISRKNAYYNKVLKILCVKAAIEKSISFHCGRHTFATLSLDSGTPLIDVSTLLGHKNIRETQIYAKVLDKNKDAAMDIWDNF